MFSDGILVLFFLYLLLFNNFHNSIRFQLQLNFHHIFGLTTGMKNQTQKGIHASLLSAQFIYDAEFRYSNFVQPDTYHFFNHASHGELPHSRELNLELNH
jgi:hypothetical protein